MATATSPQKRRHYPSQLELFHQCRRRYLYKVLERRSVDEPFSPALAKGTVAHQVLKICGAELMESGCVPADLRSLVADRLPGHEYPTEVAWEADVTEVVEWVKYGLSCLDPYATVLGAELFLDRSYRPDDGAEMVPVGVVIDLVLLRVDGSGQRFIEVIDYKTGKHIDPPMFAPVMARFALKPLIARFLPGDGFAPAIFTELYLAKRLPRTRELSLQSCLADWEEVKRTVAAIEAEDIWAPTPSPLCRWCPFNGNGCLPGSAEDMGDEDLW